MALTLEEEVALRESWQDRLEEGEAVDRLRAHCMAQGEGGLRDLAFTLRELDEDMSGHITEELLLQALEQRGIGLPPDVVHDVFLNLDPDGLGYIPMDNLLGAVRPPMVDTRMALIEEAYGKLDCDGTGIVAAAALRDNLNCEFHPMLAAGEWGPDDVMEKYIGSMTGGRDEITRDAFIAYYATISSQIEDDEMFENLMRTAWAL